MGRARRQWLARVGRVKNPAVKASEGRLVLGQQIVGLFHLGNRVEWIAEARKPSPPNQLRLGHKLGAAFIGKNAHQRQELKGSSGGTGDVADVIPEGMEAKVVLRRVE